MEKYLTDKIRNLALVGHSGVGKTQLVEALLYETGAIKRRGKVEDGNTMSDFKNEEILKRCPCLHPLFQLNMMDLR